MNPFTAHPASVGESYTQHLGVATRFGLRMIAGGLGALAHGRTISALHAEIVAKRADEAQRRSVEFVI